MWKFQKKFTAEKISKNLVETLRNCEENFKKSRRNSRKCAEVLKKIWGYSEESLGSWGENFKKFSEKIKKLLRKF